MESFLSDNDLMLHDGVRENIVAHLTSLRQQFCNYFPVIPNDEASSWMRNPFNIDTSHMASMDLTCWAGEVNRAVLWQNTEGIFQKAHSVGLLNKAVQWIPCAFWQGCVLSPSFCDYLPVRERLLFTCCHKNKVQKQGACCAKPENEADLHWPRHCRTVFTEACPHPSH